MGPQFPTVSDVSGRIIMDRFAETIGNIRFEPDESSKKTSEGTPTAKTEVVGDGDIDLDCLQPDLDRIFNDIDINVLSEHELRKFRIQAIGRTGFCKDTARSTEILRMFKWKKQYDGAAQDEAAFESLDAKEDSNVKADDFTSYWEAYEADLYHRACRPGDEVDEEVNKEGIEDLKRLKEEEVQIKTEDPDFSFDFELAGVEDLRLD